MSMAAMRPPRLRSVLEAGVPLCLGSDGPLNPWLGVMLAATHPKNPDEAITVEQALIAYTAGSAYAELAEDDKGRLAPGYLADFALLSQDVFDVPVERIPETRAVLTVVGGAVVYRAPAP